MINLKIFLIFQFVDPVYWKRKILQTRADCNKKLEKLLRAIREDQNSHQFMKKIIRDVQKMLSNITSLSMNYRDRYEQSRVRTH